MLTRSPVALGMLAAMLAAGNAFAVSREAQEFMSIQSKMAPDQCELQRLSSQAAAAQRAGDRGKRIQLDGQMEAVVKRSRVPVRGRCGCIRCRVRRQQRTRSVDAAALMSQRP